MALVLSVARIARKMRRSSSQQDSAVPGNCAQGAQEEVAPREDHDHIRGGEHEQRRMEKPGQSRNRVVERENPAVVMLAGDADELRRTLGVARAVVGIERSGADHDRAIMRKAKGPRELEERVDENSHDEELLGVPQERRGVDEIGNVAEHRLHLVADAQRRSEPASRIQRTRCAWMAPTRLRSW
jgi:hypothetical protein